MQGRTMSPILAPSAKELIQPDFVSLAAMARPEILCSDAGFSADLYTLGARTANTALKILR